MKKLCCGLTAYTLVLFGNPENPAVMAGNAAFKGLSSKELEITASDKSIIHWEKFSVQKDELARFVLPSSSSSVLNRVTGGQISHLLGKVESNGAVYLINPSGIVVGKDAVLDMAKLTLSTLDILDNQFLEQNEIVFSGNSKASLVHQGTIQASDGDVVFVSYQIENSGKISAPNGAVRLGVGQEVILKPSGDERLFIRAQLPEENRVDVGAMSSGEIDSLDAEIKGDGNLYRLAINHTGKINALQSEERDGKVFLIADGGIALSSGEIRAREVSILGAQVGLVENASIDVSASGDAGRVIIGSQETSYTYIGDDVKINADSKDSGKGGSVIIWSKNMTASYGTISARGGETSGDGGFVEISSLGGLLPNGPVDTRAPSGKGGTLLFDPCVVTLAAMATTPGVTTTPPPDIMYDFDSLGGATIDVSAIAMQLLTNNVTINASASGSLPAGNGSITLTDGAMDFISWMAATPTKLTLIADNTIAIYNTIHSSGVMASNDTVVIDLQAPNVYIGKTDHTLTVAASVLATSGQINISAPLNFILSGGAMANNAALTATNIDISAGNISTIAGPVSASAAITGGNLLNIRFTGDILILAQGGGAGITTQLPGPTTIDIRGDGNISLFGGTDGMCAAGLSIVTGATGTLTSVINGDYFITGGAATIDSNAFIGLQSGSATVSLTGRNFYLTGGNSSMGTNNAFIGTVSGTLNLNATGSDGIVLNGGTASNCTSDILVPMGSGGDVFINTTNLTLRSSFTAGTTNANALIQVFGGDVTINATGDVSLRGSDIGSLNVAFIQADNLSLKAQNVTLQGGAQASSLAEFIIGTMAGTDGNIFLDVANDLTLIGGEGSSSFASIFGSGMDAVMNFNVGRNINLIGGVADASIIQGSMSSSDINFTAGGNFNMIGLSTGSAVVFTTAGNITSAIKGDYTITAGAQGGFIGAGFATSIMSPLRGDLTLSGGNYFLTSGTGGSSAGIVGGVAGSGNVNISSDGAIGITMIGGTSDSTDAIIATLDMINMLPTNNINIQINNPKGSLLMQGSPTTGPMGDSKSLIVTFLGGQITVSAGQDILLKGTDDGLSACLLISGIMAPGTETMILRAGRNISVESSSVVANTGTGGIIAICDDKFKNPPAIGPGGLFVAPTAQIISFSTLQIFSSSQSNNDIQGSLSFFPFTPGAEFINTAQEKWGIYYPSSFQSLPFVIFYKNIFFPTSILTKFNNGVYEAVRDWANFDIFYWDEKAWEVSNTEGEAHSLAPVYANYHTAPL